MRRRRVYFPSAEVSSISLEKFQIRIFDGPQVWELMKKSTFNDTLSPHKLKGWRSLNSVSKHFLGKNQSADREKQVDELVRKVVKRHFPQSHFDCGKWDCGSPSAL